MAEECLGTGKLPRFGAKQKGDPYVGYVSKRKVKDLEEEVKKMRQEVADLKARNWGSPVRSQKRLTSVRRSSGGRKGKPARVSTQTPVLTNHAPRSTPTPRTWERG